MSEERTARKAGEHAYRVAKRLAVRLLALTLAGVFVVFAAWLAPGGPLWLVVSIQLAGLIAIVIAYRKYFPRIDRWLQGASGERRVGAALDRLSDAGWLTLHDVCVGRGNIDHLLIGPGGIFTVETKSRKRPLVVDRIHPGPLKQAYAQKKAIERITGYAVQPLLVYSDAWLIGRVPAKRGGVVVLSARMLESYISQKTPVVTSDRARQVHRSLAVALAE